MKLKNSEILNFVQNFDKNFKQETQYFPARVNFYLYKNIKPLMEAAESAMMVREDIFKRFGRFDEQKQGYVFTDEGRELANKELKDLLNLEQEVNITMLNLKDLEGLKFTPEQMNTIFFMIEEN